MSVTADVHGDDQFPLPGHRNDPRAEVKGVVVGEAPELQPFLLSL